MILSKETGKQIRRLLADSGISVREVQEKLGLESPQAVYKWLNGKSLPTLENALSLSRILGVRMEDILIFDESEPLEGCQPVLDQIQVASDHHRPENLQGEKEQKQNTQKSVRRQWMRQLSVYACVKLLNPAKFRESARQAERKIR